MQKWKTIVIIILSVLLAISTSLIGWIKLSHNWKPKPYVSVKLEQPIDATRNVPKCELKRLVDKLVGVPHFYAEKGERMQNWGYSQIMFRRVVINSHLKGEDYVITYTHELVHLKYWCENETYTSFKTFVALYESENVILRNVAERYAYSVITLGEFEGTEYDCGFYILRYLNK